jgi:TRAP-type C4-dicarboxylate transport system substrate-binding protein
MFGDKTIKLIFHNIHEHGVEIADMWMDEVRKRSGSQVTFKKQTGEDPVAIARADIIRDVPAMSDRYPLLNLVQIPFIFPDSTSGSRTIAQLYAEFPELRRELGDVKTAGLGTGAMMAIFSSRAWGPVRTIEDFKGARIRSLGPIDNAIESLGARPVHVGYLEIPRLLENGELDATVLGLLPAMMFHLAEGPAPYCTFIGRNSITMHPMRIYVKLSSWQKLPSDIHKAIEQIGPSGGDCWFAVSSGRDADKHLKEVLAYFQERGELITLSPEESARWLSLMQPAIDAEINKVEAKGLPAQVFINRLTELVQNYSSSR